MEINFKDQTVLVTGATRGIGKAIADDLYQAGAHVLLTGTNPDTIQRLNRELNEKNIPRKEYLQVDFSDNASLRQFLQRLETYPQIHACINNAGINRIAMLDETKEEDYDQILQVNLKSTFMICRQLGTRMKAANYGRIVNIASIWSVVTRPGRSIYTVSKFGMDGLTRTAAVELAPYNVLVNTVSPGFTMTELTAATNTPQQIEEITKMIPARRMAQPHEIAKTVLFLASDLNTYMTGQNLAVDGGYTNV